MSPEEALGALERLVSEAGGEYPANEYPTVAAARAALPVLREALKEREQLRGALDAYQCQAERLKSEEQKVDAAYQRIVDELGTPTEVAEQCIQAVKRDE